MKGIQTFMMKLKNYYGTYPSQIVADEIAGYLKGIKPNDFQRIYDYVIQNRARKFGVDLQIIAEAVYKQKISKMHKPRNETTCPVCLTVSYTSSGCPKCCYDGGDVAEYKKFYADWQAGIVQKTDVSGLLRGVVRKKVIK